MLVPMAKVEIIGPKNHFFELVSMIHDQGRLHIEDLSKKISDGNVPLDRMDVVDEQLRERDRMEEQLVRVRSIIKALEHGESPSEAAVRTQYTNLYDLEATELAERVDQVIAEVEERTASLAGAHTDLEAELSRLARYEPILQKIQPLARQIVTTGAYESVALLFERRYKSALEALKEELDRLTHAQYELVSTDVDEDTTAAIIVFDRRYSDAVHKFLAVENINQIRLPNEFEGMPFDTAYDEIKQRRSSMPQNLEQIRAELNEMSLKWRARLEAIRNVLIDKIDEIDAIPKFGRTEYAFVVTGWMPINDVPDLRKAISERWGDDIIVTQTDIKEEDYASTPVALKNNPRIAPFQTLVGAYGMPRYGTMDPTWMLFVFYPLFFGMIVGDFGYGLIMLGIVLWLRYKFRTNNVVQMATTILGPAATSVIAFGLLYGEFFGDLMSHYLHWITDIQVLGVTLPFHRVQLALPFMFIAVATGAVHVLMGLVLGIINAVRTKNKHHLYEKTGILTFLLGVAVAILFSLPLATETLGTWSLAGQTAFAGVALVGFFFALKGGKVMGAIEIVESMSHMASYIRIMAVGLAGAIFADAINGIVAGMSDMIFLGVLVGVVLHSLNFVIVCFSPTIHALRLNFLEFFGKFYEIGQQQYSPFVKTGGEKNV
jgi:V/A-type H+/Na+-transporting ATPase subunit I